MPIEFTAKSIRIEVTDMRNQMPSLFPFGGHIFVEGCKHSKVTIEFY